MLVVFVLLAENLLRNFQHSLLYEPCLEHYVVGEVQDKVFMYSVVWKRNKALKSFILGTAELVKVIGVAAQWRPLTLTRSAIETRLNLFEGEL